MKKLLFILAMLCFGSYQIEAQKNWTEEQLLDSIQGKPFFQKKALMEAYYENRFQGRGSGYKQWARADWFYSPRLYPEGTVEDVPMRTLEALVEYERGLIKGAETHSGFWSFQGPTSHVTLADPAPSIAQGGWNGGIGRVNFIEFHPSNSNILFASTAGGGLWKSTTDGNSWTSLTDGLPIIPLNGVAVDHSNANIIYVLTGEGDPTVSIHGSMGVFKSVNGGRTWQATGLTFQVSNLVRAYDLRMDPNNSNVLYAATGNGLWQTTDAGVSWNQLITPAQDGRLYDIDFKPGSSSTMYVGGSRGVWRRTSTTGNFTLFTGSNLPNFTSNTTRRVEIAVTNANSNYVYAIVASRTTDLIGIYRSTNSGASWSTRYTTPNLLGLETAGAGSQATKNLSLAVSHSDVNDVILGGGNTYRSTNGGTSWTRSSYWREDGTEQYTHADIHELRYNGSKLYCCSDGGVYRSLNDGVTWTDRSNGLGITQWYGIGGTPQNVNLIYGGTQDNGSNKRTNNTMTHVRGADGMKAMIDYTNQNRAYTTRQNGALERTDDGGVTFTNVTPPSNNGNWVTPILMDPVVPATIFSGRNSVWRSTNQGANWTNLNWPGPLVPVEMAQSTSVRNRLYVTEGNVLRRLDNALGTAPFNWINITGTLPVASAQMTDIAVNPSFSGDVFVTFSGYSAANKVFRSTNANGSSPTWTNITGSLPNVPINTIVYENDGGSNFTDRIYVGTDLGVFYRDNTIGDWIYFSNGMPNCVVADLYINYGSNRIWAGTYGRGLWSSSLYSDCPATYFLSDANNPSTSGQQYYEASQQVNSSRDYDGGAGTLIEYQAGDRVTLTPGFELEAHSVGEFRIDPCTFQLQAKKPKTGVFTGPIPGAIVRSKDDIKLKTPDKKK